jgi:competence protein ComEC
VDFLDVGQGDSILIKTQFGQNILIDGGPDNSVLGELGKKLSWWDRKIDLMILTHPHDDHVMGLIGVLQRYKVEKILYTGVTHTAPNYIKWLETVRDQKIPMVIIDRPQTINFGTDCDLDILYPNKPMLGQTISNLNNSSIVSLLNCSEKKFLFMGDAEVEVEKDLTPLSPLLIRRGEASDSEWGEVDILKVGHHGSDTSSGEDFLNMVKPKIAIIPVGKDNKFGHPSLRVIKRLERVGAEIYRTDLSGDIQILVKNNELLINNQ